MYYWIQFAQVLLGIFVPTLIKMLICSFIFVKSLSSFNNREMLVLKNNLGVFPFPFVAKLYRMRVTSSLNAS